MNISIMMLWWNYLLTMVVCRVPLSFLFFANTHLAFSCMLCSWNENKIHYKISLICTIIFNPGRKEQLQDRPARPGSNDRPAKTLQQDQPPRPSSKTGQQRPASKDQPAKTGLQDPAAMIGQQDWPAKTLQQDRPARLASKTGQQDWQAGPASKVQPARPS